MPSYLLSAANNASSSRTNHRYITHPKRHVARNGQSNRHDCGERSGRFLGNLPALTAFGHQQLVPHGRKNIMLRALVFAGIAAVAGRQLYKNGSLQRFGDKARERADELKKYAEEKRESLRTASSEPATSSASRPLNTGTLHTQGATSA
jgi:hypothetical protein